jgi:hypothetical protein
MANEAVNQVIADYYRDFSTLNVQAILRYFNEPSLLVGTQGVIPIPDRSALVAVFGPVMEGLRAKDMTAANSNWATSSRLVRPLH